MQHAWTCFPILSKPSGTCFSRYCKLAHTCSACDCAWRRQINKLHNSGFSVFREKKNIGVNADMQTAKFEAYATAIGSLRCSTCDSHLEYRNVSETSRMATFRQLRAKWMNERKMIRVGGVRAPVIRSGAYNRAPDDERYFVCLSLSLISLLFKLCHIAECMPRAIE